MAVKKASRKPAREADVHLPTTAAARSKWIFAARTGHRCACRPRFRTSRRGRARTARTGRPKLGVVAREVTLLPRHWEWLGAQPGGASVAMRKLVEEARRSNGDRIACARPRSGLSFHVGDGRQLADYEEAARALFAGDGGASSLIAGWPDDIRDHVASSRSAIGPRG